MNSVTCFIIVFLCQIVNTLTTNVKCAQNVDITDGIREGKSVIKDGVVYTEGNYFESDGTLRGCICKIKLCVRKCCAEGESLNLTTKTCLSSSTDGVLSDFSTYKIITVPENNICTDAQVRVKIDKDFSVIDGVLVWDDLSFAMEDFCMSTVNGQNFAIGCVDGEGATVNVLYSLGMIISMPFLLITFLVYAILPEKNLHRKALMSYVLTLLLGYLLLVSVQLYTNHIPPVPCNLLGHLIIFFFLVSFFWMNVMCLDMWLAFSGIRGFHGRNNAEQKRFLLYCCYAWGMPTLHVLIVYLLNTYSAEDAMYNPQIAKQKCFLGDGYPNLFYFYLPMAILIGINIVLFITTAIKIQKVKKETAMLKHSDSKRHSYEDDKQKFNLYLKLLFAMGINWTMEIISWAIIWKMGTQVPSYVWYLTDFINAMYGVFIFFIFVFKRKIWRSLKKRFYICLGRPHLAQAMTSTRTTRTSNYSTTDMTATTNDYRMNEIPNGRGEERALNMK